jgi:lipopolysaccharide export system protein LptA
MPWTIERLRLGLVAVAVFLVLAILGFLLYARWRTRHLTQDLPARLGLKVQQSTQGFVLSKTEEGRTIFTLHASRAVAFKSGGRVLLHNVEIDVFNRDGKADTIAGKNFQYDRTNQIVESQGEAHILLQPPQSEPAGGAEKKAGQPIRVTTHGLVFNQKTGVATCSGQVDFQIAGSHGQAVGAEYDSHQGHLLLQSQVVLITTMQSGPAVVHATQAVYDRNDDQVHLQKPRYSSATQQGNQRGSADAATVFFRPDGSAQRLDAFGAVHLDSSDGDTIEASSLHAVLNGNSRPQHVHFLGDVRFAQNQPDQQGAGTARDLAMDFDEAGHARRAVFNGDVRFHQQLIASDGRAVRSLRSQYLDLHLAATKAGQSELQSAVATGDAVFRSQSFPAGKPAQETRISGQTLHARFLAGNQIEHMDGSGQTEIRTVAQNGDVDSSSGDTLTVDFATGVSVAPMHQVAGRLATGKSMSVARGGKPLRSAEQGSSAQSIRYALQTGHVVLQQISSKQTGTPGPPQVSTATATRAEYRSSSDTLVLTGQPVFRNSQMELAANVMQVQRATQKVTALGAVQGTLLQSATATPSQAAAGNGLLGGGSQPVHIIAARAVLLHDPRQAIFSGRARLWQEGETVEAPIIEISQKMQTLLAYAEGPCSQCVHTVFASQNAPPKGDRPAKGAKPQVRRPSAPQGSSNSGTSALFNPNAPQVFRVLSQRLLYSDAERKATFTDHVEVLHAGDNLFADRAAIFLSQGPAPPSGNKNLPAGSNKSSQTTVERIVATGDVRLVQPGRHATGSRLVYTASDGTFVLTGDRKQPQVVDAIHGTVSGPVLTFASQEQAIIVGGTSERPTTTATRVKKN